MKVVLQRVSESSVEIDSKVIGNIDAGLLLLIGYEKFDNYDDIDWVINKVLNIRIFDDENGKMNLSVKDINGDLLLISQFTLFASTSKGNRPSFVKAADPILAKSLYDYTIKQFRNQFSGNIQKGEFGKVMKVRLVNEGPVTIILDSKNKL
jgi:D-tyrosyl-tRNA(Tyr) deacylase